MIKLTSLTKELIEDIEEARRHIEELKTTVLKIEKLVAGQNAAFYKSGERLINMAESALEESQVWFEGIK